MAARQRDVVAAAQHRDVSGSLAAARQRRQRGSDTARRSLAAVQRRRQRQRRCGAAVAAHIATVCSVLQEQEEATRARRYRFLKQNEREKLTYFLELKKIQ